MVDGEEAWRQYCARAFGAFGAVHRAASLGEARAALEVHPEFAGIVTEAMLPDGSGFDLLETLRDRKPPVLSLVLTSHNDREHINRARFLQAGFVCKPPSAESLEGFARRAITHHWTRDIRVAQVVDALALERRLTPREAEIVAASVAGMPRRLVASEIGVSENTVKVQIRQLLLKCKATSLDEVADGVLRKALSGSGLHRAVGAGSPGG